MPYYMHQWAYKDSQFRKFVTEPQNRAEIVRVAVEAFGGKLHQFFFTFGEYDGISISEFKDNETALACLMAIVGQGALAVMRSTVLLTPEEAERAMGSAREKLRGPEPNGR
jgi:uncharacterized protein with GYD domain